MRSSTPRLAVLHMLVQRNATDRPARYHAEALTADAARRGVRRARRAGGDVAVYETTDRAGTPFHLVRADFGCGTYTDVFAVTDIYEIPTSALTDL